MGIWGRIKKELGNVQITNHLTVAEFLSGSPPKKPNPKKPAPRLCVHCGHALSESTIFCPGCGIRIETTGSPTPNPNPMSRFARPTHQSEDEDMVRVDLTEEWYTLLMRSLENDDARFIRDYLRARLQKDKKGYFLRLPYPDVRLLLGTLRLLWSDISNEVIRIIPEAFSSLAKQNETEQTETPEAEEALARFEAMSERKRDLQTLIEVFDYQMCPEEHRPFGPR